MHDHNTFTSSYNNHLLQNPVCGSNGLTYLNKCFLDRQVCQTGAAITYVDGECDTPVAGTTKTTKMPTTMVSAAGTCESYDWSIFKPRCFTVY